MRMAAASVFTALVAAIMASRVVVVLASYYAVNSTWRVTNSEALAVPAGAGGDTLRVVLMDAEAHNFALAFVDLNATAASSEDAFVLGIIAMPQYSYNLRRLVWSANRERPVGGNATVGFNPDGNLALRDASGAEVWSTDAQAGVRIAGLSMDKSGNLAAYDKSYVAVWESFKHPTDTILPGQRLQVGAMLVSFSSGGDPSLPVYQLVVEHAGVALYAPGNLSASRPQQQMAPYFVSSLNLQHNLRGVLATCQHPAMVTLDGTQGLEVSYDLSLTSPSASSEPALCSTAYSERALVLPNYGQNAPHQFVKLDSDGNLRLYIYLPGSSGWQVVSTVLNSKCDLPGACSKYGVCFQDRCTCSDSSKVDLPTAQPHQLTDDAHNSTSYSHYYPMENALLLTCEPPSASVAAPGASILSSTGNCTNSGNSREEIFALDSTDYFSNQYVSPDFYTSTILECGQHCLNSCSCSASFFHNDSGACFVVPDVHSLQRVTQTGYSALLKVMTRTDPASGPDAQDLVASRKRINNSIAIGVSVGLGSAGLLLVILLWTLYRLLGKKKGQVQVQKFHEAEAAGGGGEDELLETLPGLPPRYTFKDLSTATNGFQVRLGSSSSKSGAFGSVYGGRLADGSRVAVKRLEAGKEFGSKDFRIELAKIGSIHHLNLVRLRGFCIEGNHRLLVCEYVSKGSLDKWLFAPKEGAEELKTDGFVLDWNTRFKIALGTARGLSYLHEESPSKIIHMNVKPQNILLDERFLPKISDYGLSKLMAVGVDDSEASGELTTRRGTPGYSAPELLLRSHVSDKVDIYSYGVVLIELFTGRKCIDLFMEVESDYFPSWAMNMARDGRLREALDKRLGDLVPEVQCQRVIQIVYWCVHRDYKKRPSMKLVVQMLEGLVPVPEMPEAELADLSSFKLPGKDSLPEKKKKVSLLSPAQERRSMSPASKSVL